MTTQQLAVEVLDNLVHEYADQFSPIELAVAAFGLSEDDADELEAHTLIEASFNAEDIVKWMNDHDYFSN